MSTDSNNTVDLGQIKSSKCYINIDYILQDQKISFEVFKSSLNTNCVLFKRNIPLDKLYQSKSCTQIQSNGRITYLKADKMIQTEGRSWLSPLLSPDNLGPPPFYRSGSPNSNRNYESPVRDKPQQKAPQTYKENYEVSKFKFPEPTPVPRNAHANFCELSFDGTKSKKQRHSVHHRTNKTQFSIKKVTSDTKLNYLNSISLQNKQQQEEFSKRIRDKLDRYSAKHHKPVHFNKQEVTFDEHATEIKKKSVLASSSRPKSRRKEKTAFELVLSAKEDKIEKPANLSNKSQSRSVSPRRKPKKIIVTSTTLEPIATYVHKYNLQSSDVKDPEKEPEKLERNESINELFVKSNFRSPSTEKSFHGETDQHAHHHKKKKRKKHLTMTVFPCLEIKCSSKHLEMPVGQVVRPKMPRRTITPEEIKVLTSSMNEKFSSNDEERKKMVEQLQCPPNIVPIDQNQDKQVLPSHPSLALACNSSQPSFLSTFDQNNANIPSQHLSFVSASNESNPIDVETPNDNLKNKLTNILTTNKTEDYNKKIEDLCTLIGNLITQKPEKGIKKLHRSRSVTPERERALPTSDSIKKNSEESTDLQGMFSTSKIFNTSTISFPTATDSTPSYPPKMKNLQIIHNNNQAVTISEDTSKYTLCDNYDSKEIQKSLEQKFTTVPKNVFVIPSHVNKILKRYDMKKITKPSSISTNATGDQNIIQQEKYNTVAVETSNSKPPDVINYKLAEIVRKPSIKQKLAKLDSLKCPKKDVILPKKTLHAGVSKIAKDENSYSAVTFNSQVDIYENYRDTKVFQVGDEINVKNTLIHVSSKAAIKRSKTLPSKQDFYKKNDLHSPKSSDTYDSKHSRDSNHGFQSDRQSDKKPRPGSILNSTFLTTKKETTNSNNTFQKRKEYYNKLKMQMRKTNESDMEKTTEYETPPPKSSYSSILKPNSVGTSNHSSVSANTVTEIRVTKAPLKNYENSPSVKTENKMFYSRIPKLTARPQKTNLFPYVFHPQDKPETLDENQPKTFLKLFPLNNEQGSTRDVKPPITYTQLAENHTQTFQNNINTYFNSASYNILSRNSTKLATERRRKFLKRNGDNQVPETSILKPDRQVMYTILNSYPPRPHINVYLDKIKKEGYIEHTVMCVERNNSDSSLKRSPIRNIWKCHKKGLKSDQKTRKLKKIKNDNGTQKDKIKKTTENKKTNEKTQETNKKREPEKTRETKKTVVNNITTANKETESNLTKYRPKTDHEAKKTHEIKKTVPNDKTADKQTEINLTKYRLKTDRNVVDINKNKKEFCRCCGYVCKCCCCKPKEVDDSNTYFRFSRVDNNLTQPQLTHSVLPVIVEPSNLFQNSISSTSLFNFDEYYDNNLNTPFHFSKRKREVTPTIGKCENQSFSERLTSEEVINLCDNLLLSPRKDDSKQSKKSKHVIGKIINRINHFFRRKTSDLMRIVGGKKLNNQ